jgi:uncharacterized membrane protein
MNAPPPAPAPQPAPRIGEWLSESFNLYQQEWKTWTGQGLVFVVLGYLPAMLAVAYMYSVILSLRLAETPHPPLTPEETRALLTATGVLFGGTVLSTFSWTYFWVGMSRTAAKQLRGEPIRVGDIFGGGDAYLPALLAAFGMWLAYLVGALFCLFPGLIVWALLAFAHPLVVEGRMGPLQALRTSWATTRPHLVLYVIWFWLVFIIGNLGSNLLWLGMAFTWPIYVLGTMVAYRDVYGLPGALPPRSGPTAPPGAAPPRSGATFLSPPDNGPQPGN